MKFFAYDVTLHNHIFVNNLHTLKASLNLNFSFKKQEKNRMETSAGNMVRDAIRHDKERRQCEAPLAL